MRGWLWVGIVVGGAMLAGCRAHIEDRHSSMTSGRTNVRSTAAPFTQNAAPSLQTRQPRTADATLLVKDDGAQSSAKEVPVKTAPRKKVKFVIAQ